MPPSRLGRYIVDRQLGVGGMAYIHLARAVGHGGFEKQVVIKELLPQLAEDAEFVERFLQEARIVATLDHPHIASVHDVGQDGSRHYFAMEYVPGRDLRSILRKARARGRALSIEEVLAVGISLCSALHYAHEKRDARGRHLALVHRDVSPSNLLVSTEGTLKLVDFGIAKVRTSMVSTAAGSIRGKIPYMAPEQARGERVDRRTDVFAAGLVLWEMLVGARAVADDNEHTMLLAAIAARHPRVDTLRADCPRPLADLVAHALRPGADDRPPDAQMLREALEEIARTLRLRSSSIVLSELMQELFDAQPHGSEAQAPRTPADDATATYSPTELGVAPHRDGRRAWLLTAAVGATALAAALLWWGAWPVPEPSAPAAAVHRDQPAAEPQPPTPAAKDAPPNAPAHPPAPSSPTAEPAEPDRSEPQPTHSRPRSAGVRKRGRGPKRGSSRRRTPEHGNLESALPPGVEL